MSTEWRPIQGFEGLYEISSNGQIRSLDRLDRLGRRTKGRILAFNRRGDDHLQVQLWRDGKCLTRKVHQLVLEAFAGPRPSEQEVRHLDGDPANNRLSNLCYGTHGENMLDKVRHGSHMWAAKTHCPEGHPYSGGNLYIAPDGGRECRACMRESGRRYRGRLRAEAAGMLFVHPEADARRIARATANGG